ncbi:MAG: class I SAM-dependent DNA methyltransferase [Planctomycetota bacterium]|jgi:SAM-dependent methyltransferase
MFTESIPYYDEIYAWKDYETEARELRALIAKYQRSDGNRLLDLACGTGGHFPYLREHFEVEGLDLAPEFLKLARARNPGLTFHEGDMARLNLGRAYDVITCLFSSVGYLRTVERLRSMLTGVAGHLRRGGVAFLEPWFRPDQFKVGAVFMGTVDEPELKICRMSRSEVDGTLSIVHFHYLVGTPADGVRRFEERHVLAGYSVEQFAEAGRAAGLEHAFLEEGLHGSGERGLHVFTQPL